MVELVVGGDVGVGREEKAASATRGVGYDLAGYRTNAVNQCVNQRLSDAVPPRTALRVLGVSFQQAFVSVAFDIRRHLQPRLVADQVDGMMSGPRSLAGS